jgi:hypothetical protein
MGPGGGLAIGEKDCERDFFAHAPEDRKFDRKMLAGKHLVILGQTRLACQAADEFVNHFPHESETRLTWIVRPRGPYDSQRFLQSHEPLQRNTPRNVVIIESLGVESIVKQEGGAMRLRLLKEDDSTVDLDADLVMRRTGHRYRSIAPELNEYPSGPIGFSSQLSIDCPPFITAEPGYYSLHGGTIEDGPGEGIPNAFQQIRQVFALLGGRHDLDLYSIIEKQMTSG